MSQNSDSSSSSSSAQRKELFKQDSLVFMPDREHSFIPARTTTEFSQGQEGHVLMLSPLGEEVTSAHDKPNAKLPPRAKKPKVHKIPGHITDQFMIMDDQSLHSIDDMVDLTELNDAAILHNLRLRYAKNEIYTSIGAILISVNPYRVLPIYTPEMIRKFMDFGHAKLGPHVYGTADAAYRNMIENDEHQSCIVSGESGAGKTEATKLFMNYIAEISGQGETRDPNVESIQQQVLEANPLMEAFGNAKTTRNDNSSRFGKWISIHFDRNQGHMIGGKITQYLLEKSRLVRHSPGERTYHIFYQMCAAAQDDASMAEKYSLREAEVYPYLNQAHGKSAIKVDDMDDMQEWKKTLHSMDVMGFAPDVQEELFRLIAGIMHFGAIRFGTAHILGKDDAAYVENEDMLNLAAEQLGTDAAKLKRVLTKKDVSVSNETIYAEYSQEGAQGARNALAKAIYGRMFNWVVERINQSLEAGTSGSQVPSSGSETIIGILDIFGFETFDHNSFEQLCINYCNEKLQSFFNIHIFQKEQQEYLDEGIDVQKVGFRDNDPILRAIETKHTGILARIDEEGMQPRGSDERLLSKLLSMKTVLSSDKEKEPRIKKPDVRKLRDDKEMANCFILVHYTGDVIYNVTGFLEKNRDTLIEELEEVCVSSSSAMLREFFDDSANPEHEIRRVNSKNRSDRRGLRRTIGIQFRDQLADLMETLEETRPHFIRCIKPNDDKLPEKFVAPMIMEQLRYSGLLEVTRIRKKGYPVRRQHDEFVTRYACLVPGFPPDGNIETLVHHLVQNNMLVGSDWQRGHTKMFLRDHQQRDLELYRERAHTEYAVKIQKVFRGYRERIRYRRYEQILQELDDITKSDDIETIESTLLSAGELPHDGRHLPVVEKAKKHLDKLKGQVRVLELINEAVEAKDKASLESAIAAAKDAQMKDFDEVKNAESLLEKLEREQQIRQTLRDALNAEDVDKLEEAIEEASAIGMNEDPDFKSAVALRDRRTQEKEAIDALEAALAEDPPQPDKIFSYLETMASLGLNSHPSVARGEEIAQKAFEENKQFREEVARTERELNNAMNDRDIDALARLKPKVIQLGITERSPTAKNALEMLNQLTYEREALSKMEAEIKTVRVKAKSYDGITRHDLRSLTKAIKDVTEKGLGDHPRVVRANNYQRRMVKQLVVQEQLKSALRNKNLEEMKEVALKATKLGMETEMAKRVYAELRNLESKAKLSKKVAGSRKRSLETGVVPKLLGNEGKEQTRAQMNRLAATVSREHVERMSTASDDIYSFERFYKIRDDEDFTRNEVPRLKRARAKLKLQFQKTPISRSIVAYQETELTTGAIWSFSSLLGWCGDSNSPFPAAMAHDILQRGFELPELADEIYLQLCKQLTNNPSSDSIDRCWILMCMATKLLPPSDEFILHLMNFLMSHRQQPGLIGNYARLCLMQLDEVVQTGLSWYTPSIEDVQLFEKRPPVLATIHLVDGTARDIAVSPDMTVDDIVHVMAQLTGVPETDEQKMGIFVTPREFLAPKASATAARVGFDVASAISASAVRASQDSVDLDDSGNTYQGRRPDGYDSGPGETFAFREHQGQMELMPVNEGNGEDAGNDNVAGGNGIGGVIPGRHIVGEQMALGGSESIKAPLVSMQGSQESPHLSVAAYEGPASCPAPKTPWPLPGFVHLGDIVSKMARQGREPVFSYKRKIFLEPKKDRKPDRLLFYQLVQDTVAGSLPVGDEAEAVALVAIAMAAQIPEIPSEPQDLIKYNLMSFIPLPWYAKKTETEWAEAVHDVAKVLSTENASALRQRFIDTCLKNPLYGMSIFYAHREDEARDIRIGVSYAGVHFLGSKMKIERSIIFPSIMKYGASHSLFWFAILENRETKVFHLHSLQSAEIYDVVTAYMNLAIHSRLKPGARSQQSGSLLSSTFKASQRTFKSLTRRLSFTRENEAQSPLARHAQEGQ